MRLNIHYCIDEQTVGGHVEEKSTRVGSEVGKESVKMHLREHAAIAVWKSMQSKEYVSDTTRWWGDGETFGRDESSSTTNSSSLKRKLAGPSAGTMITSC